MGSLPNGIHTVVMAVGDTNGIMRGKRIPANQWDRICAEGMAMSNAVFVLDVACGAMATPYTNLTTGFPDLFVFPHETEVKPLGWEPGVGFCLGRAQDEHGEPIPIDPRTVMVKTVAKAKAMGFEVSIGAELEFYLLDPVTLLPRQTGIDVYGLDRAMELEPVLGPIREHLSAAGIPIEQSNPEYAAGQVEVNIRHGDAMSVADQVVAFRGFVKQLARSQELVATFMSKPFFDEAGSGFHVHHSLWRDGTPLFADNGKLSTLGRQYLAGLRAHMAQTAICSAATPNAYRRRQPNSFCPTNNTWGYDNRTVALRVLEGSDHAVRIEQRDGSADINPYLLLASQIAAGLKGIEDDLDPGDPELGNGYENTTATPLPLTLPQAIDAARNSTFVKELLGPDLFGIWISQAEREEAIVNRQVTPVEIERYLRRF